MKFFTRTVIGAARPGVDEPPLMIRYVIFRCAAFGIYLHHFCRSDHDRALHDHPWPYVAIILKGGYWEVHDQDRAGQVVEWRGPGSVLLRPAQWRHRIALPVFGFQDDGRQIQQPSWSLVFVGRRAQRWGFFTPQGWCWWRKYDPWKAICEDGVLFEGGED